MLGNLFGGKAFRSGARAQAATNPADFPLGSPESRALARRLAEERDQMSLEDADALIIYLLGDQEIENTTLYQRGRELYEARVGAPVPVHEDPKQQRFTFAGGEFELAFGHEPKTGDILRRADVESSRAAVEQAKEFERFIEAWNRNRSEFEHDCPTKVEGERVYVRASSAGADDLWRELVEHLPEVCWRRVVREALAESGSKATGCAAVRFLGVVNGKHRCEPVTVEDLKKIDRSKDQ